MQVSEELDSIKESYSIFLHTGDTELNRLFSRRRDLGLCVGQIKCGKGSLASGRIAFQDTSIIVVEGDAGTGKTTFALQIAAAVADPDTPAETAPVAPAGRQSNTFALRDLRRAEIKAMEPGEKNEPAPLSSAWRVVFISLEQSSTSIQNTVRHFGFGGDSHDKRFPDLAGTSADAPAPKAGQVQIFNLSPLPLSGSSADEIFAERFGQLRHMVNEVTKTDGQNEDDDVNTLFVLDSLNAFIGEALNRPQLRQLFALFRSNKVPLIATVEQIKHFESHAQPVEEAPAFLADVCVRLSRDSEGSYLRSFIEVTKSRVCLQALGKHLYKTRTFESAREADASERTGLVVYPSIDFTLSRSRTDPNKESLKFEIDKDLKALDLEKPVHTPACFALQGPAGTHKLALGLNLGLSRANDSTEVRMLIVNFGGQGDIDFEGVAWIESLQHLGNLSNSDPEKNSRSSKHQLRLYETTTTADGQTIKYEVSVLTFQIGQLTPEECFFQIARVLDKKKEEKFHSVLVSDTAQLCTAFPLLSKDPVFYSALLDLFESKNMLTIGLGVHGADMPSLRDINLALNAKATHRFLFSHHPKLEKFIEGIVDHARKEADDSELKLPGERIAAEEPKDSELEPLGEQLISVIVDNVTGKHYQRKPTWIRVEQPDREKVEKFLHCELYELNDKKMPWMRDTGALPPQAS